jgi:hypothetical protein
MPGLPWRRPPDHIGYVRQNLARMLRSDARLNLKIGMHEREPPDSACSSWRDDWNAEKRVQGQIDIDLNTAGEAQARALADGLRGHPFAAVYSSDLGRAWHTAQIAVAGREIAVVPAPTLRERHFGVLQG